jgi:membrane dipeptidase
LIYYLQNSTLIGDDLAKLTDLKEKGIRIIQLTYNMRNLVGDGCLERQNSGLSTFGMELVVRMNEMGLLVDLSHCGDATTLEGIKASKKPVAITHSACKTLFNHPRNKTDDTLRALAERGGVMGIFQINPYIGAKERNTLADFLAHIDHAVKVAGVEHVGIGSDREHRRIPDTPEEKQKLIDELSRLRPVNAASFRWPFFISELNHPRRMETIAEGLAKNGYKADAVDKILGGNFYRLFKDTIG